MSSSERIFLNLLIFITAIGIFPIFFLEIQFRDPTEIFLPKITITLIIIGSAALYFSNENKNEDIKNYNYEQNEYNEDEVKEDFNYVQSQYNENEDKENVNYINQYNDNVFYNNKNEKYNKNYINKANNTYCYQTDKIKYDEITKENTKKDLDKLTKSKAFIDMFLEKGEDMNNWNWQSREKKNKSI